MSEPIEQARSLRQRVYEELRQSGFVRKNGLIVPGQNLTKDDIRARHAAQRGRLIEANRQFIDKWEDRVLAWFAPGSAVDPASISPRVHAVSTETDAAIFRYASLLWSIPVSKGFGRRTRFLVLDEQNQKLIGLFALGDPVYNLSVRDKLIGWDVDMRNSRLYNVLDAFVLGAVSPYRELIGGKLVAMAVLSEATVGFVERKYKGRKTNIQGAVKPSRPVLITTTSALGKSSLYNRFAFGGRLLFQPIGYTAGWGHFQFSEGLFDDMCIYLNLNGGVPNYEFGGGPNWRWRTLRLALDGIGLDSNLLRHGIKREVFIAPLAENWMEYLRGETDRAAWYRFNLADLAEHYRSRWAIPRAGRLPSFREFDPTTLRMGQGRLRAQLPWRL